MGKIFVSTLPNLYGVDGASFGVPGLFVPSNTPLVNYQLGTDVDFVDISSGYFDGYVTAVRSNGDLWSSIHNAKGFGITVNGDYPFQKIDTATTFVKTFSSQNSAGVHLVDSNGDLFYTGYWFRGCGLDQPPVNANDIDQITFVTVGFSGLAKVTASEANYYAAFNTSSGVFVSGNNGDYGFGLLDWSITSDAIIPFTKTNPIPSNTVELIYDAWHYNNLLTSDGELYQLSVASGPPATFAPVLIDTNVSKVIGASQNWTITYIKTDGTLHSALQWSLGGGIQVEPTYRYVDGVVNTQTNSFAAKRTTGEVDVFMYYDPRSPAANPVVYDVFPGKVIDKLTLNSYSIIGLEHTNTPQYTVPAPLWWTDLSNTKEVNGLVPFVNAGPTIPDLFLKVTLNDANINAVANEVFCSEVVSNTPYSFNAYPGGAAEGAELIDSLSGKAWGDTFGSWWSAFNRTHTTNDIAALFNGATFVKLHKQGVYADAAYFECDAVDTYDPASYDSTPIQGPGNRILTDPAYESAYPGLYMGAWDGGDNAPGTAGVYFGATIVMKLDEVLQYADESTMPVSGAYWLYFLDEWVPSQFPVPDDNSYHTYIYRLWIDGTTMYADFYLDGTYLVSATPVDLTANLTLTFQNAQSVNEKLPTTVTYASAMSKIIQNADGVFAVSTDSGWVDEQRIYNRPLTTQEITSLHNALMNNLVI